VNRPTRERPILFSGPMVCAILEGDKTITRRLVKTGSYPHAAIHWWEPAAEPGNEGRWSAKDGLGGIFHIPCPYGVSGDRLWGREAHAFVDRAIDGVDREDPVVVHYRADDTILRFDRHPPHPVDSTFLSAPTRWRPSIHMPRWASRLVLEVVSVRPERLHDISESDVYAEGFAEEWSDYRDFVTNTNCGSVPVSSQSIQEFFAGKWDEINGYRAPSSSNPWVWRIEFQRMAGGVA
jgi:hypothetical protein